MVDTGKVTYSGGPAVTGKTFKLRDVMRIKTTSEEREEEDKKFREAVKELVEKAEALIKRVEGCEDFVGKAYNICWVKSELEAAVKKVRELEPFTEKEKKG
jgi:hypothetical protein